MDDTPQRIEIIYDIILGPIYRLVPLFAPSDDAPTKVIGEIHSAQARNQRKTYGKRR